VSPTIKRVFLVLAFGLLLSSTAVAQRATTFSQGKQSLVGPQIGVATNNLNFYIGAQFSLPVADRIDVYPSFDYYFPSNSYGAFGVSVTVWGINAEGRYWPKLNMANSGLYVGGGLNITHVSVSAGGFGGSTTDAGLGLLGGWDFKSVSWHPFAQIHAVIGNADRIEFGGGVNFKL
jgi:hypothetical protein